MTAAIRVVNKTIIGAMILGRICNRRMRKVDAPMAFAALTYTFSLVEMVAPRMILDPAMPYCSPRMNMICHIPGPNMDTNTIITTKPGKIIQASTNRCMIMSYLPPINPVVVPIIVEMTIEKAVAEKPTMTESLAP